MLRRFSTGWKAVRQLGLEQVALFAAYKLGLAVGLWQRMTPVGAGDQRFSPGPMQPVFIIEHTRAAYRSFYAAYPEQAVEITREADEICAGSIRLFGGPLVPLQLVPPTPLQHWAAYEQGKISWGADPDVKLVWEPARFGWAYSLARAYLLTGNEGYAQAFWRFMEAFLEGNPPNQGPNWMSAQEVALRLMALVFAREVFDPAPTTTPERRTLLLRSIGEHASRIPPTLLYARSQNNNHLITEAAGLYTAGVLLPAHPHAARWRKLGWRWINRALQKQVEPDGSYSQHSTNYHRLMLHAALWVDAVARSAGELWPEPTRERLAAATRWLLDQVDPISGRAPNLGSNDGALILPLAPGGFGDYRPVAQAVSIAFLGEPFLPEGPWDELAWWLGLDQGRKTKDEGRRSVLEPLSFVLRPSSSSWSSLRAVHFVGRPAHADQLHVEIWHKGVNVAQDAGSFRYTAPPPWDNSLARTLVHNTVTVDDQDQMTRAGKFLWLNWAQARRLRQDERVLEAEHDGYRRLGVIHRRKLERLGEDRWRVRDTLLPSGHAVQAHSARLHWLLPDWPWTLQGNVLVLRGPEFLAQVRITTSGAEGTPVGFDLVRAGESLVRRDPQAAPILGWYSPTYNLKLPALSFLVEIRLPGPLTLPITFQSDFSFGGR